MFADICYGFMMVRVGVGRLILRGLGLGTVGAGAYTIHNAGYEVNNIGM